MFRLVFLLFCASSVTALANNALYECTLVLRHLATDPAARAPYVKTVRDSNYVEQPGSSVVLPTTQIFVPAMNGPYVEAVTKNGFYMDDPGRWLVIDRPSEPVASQDLRDFKMALGGFVSATLADAQYPGAQYLYPRFGLFSVSDPGKPLQEDFHTHEHSGEPRLPSFSVSLNAPGTETRNQTTPVGALLLFDNLNWHRTPGTVPPHIRRSFLFGDFGN